MSVLATVLIPNAAFPLGSILDAERDRALTFETAVPTGGPALPYVWVPLAESDSLLEEFRASPSVAAATLVDRLGDHGLVKLEWDDSVDGVLAAIRESEAALTSATGTDEGWRLELRFPSYEALSAFYTACRDRDVPFDILQLHEAVRPDDERRFGLTDPQREAILVAREAGYFDVPRGTTLVELGERLGVSDAAASQRLRRGLAALVDATLQPSSTRPERER